MLETGSIMTVYLVVNGTFFDLLENGSIKASNLLVQWNWDPKDARNWFHNDSLLSGKWNLF